MATQSAGGTVNEYHCDVPVTIIDTGSGNYQSNEIGVNTGDKVPLPQGNSYTAFSVDANHNQQGATGYVLLSGVEFAG